MPSFSNFLVLGTGWLLNPFRHTVSRALLASGSGGLPKHHSAFYYFFSRASWVPDHLGLVIFKLALRWIPGSEIQLIIDDTLCRKSGPHIFGGGMHHDPLVSTYLRGAARHVALAFGHNWVVSAVWVPLPWNPSRGVALPVLFRLYRSKKTAPKGSYQTRTEIAAQMIKTISGWLPNERRLDLAADNEYACRTVVKQLPEKVHFTGPMRMDASLHAPLENSRVSGRGRPPKKGGPLPKPAAMAADPKRPWEKITADIYGRRVEVLVKTAEVVWSRVAGNRPLRLVITRDPKGRIEDRAYFSTDLDLAPSEILERFAKRWCLEVAFYNCKQFLGLEEPQNGWGRRNKIPKRKKAGPQPVGDKGKRAVERTVPFIFTLYGLVNLWYFQHGNAQKDVREAVERSTWYTQKAEPSFADMLGSLRRAILLERFLNDPYFWRFVQKDKTKIVAKLDRWLAWAA